MVGLLILILELKANLNRGSSADKGLPLAACEIENGTGDVSEEYDRKYAFGDRRGILNDENDRPKKLLLIFDLDKVGLLESAIFAGLPLS